MTTTAARSVEYMKKLGFNAEAVEHMRGRYIRVDLFGFADVLAYKPGEGIILIQAYHKKEFIKHAGLVPLVNKDIEAWIRSGGRFEHHLWSFKTRHKRKFWSVEREEKRPVWYGTTSTDKAF